MFLASLVYEFVINLKHNMIRVLRHRAYVQVEVIREGRSFRGSSVDDSVLQGCDTVSVG